MALGGVTTSGTTSSATPSVVLDASSVPASGVWASIQVTHNFTKNERPQLEGNRLVWQAFDGTDWEIEAYDLSTGALTQLTDDRVDETDPKLSGDRVVWIRAQTQPVGDKAIGSDAQPSLVLFDFATGASRPVQGSEGVQDASLVGDLLVWRARSGSESDIFVNDLATGQT